MENIPTNKFIYTYSLYIVNIYIVYIYIHTEEVLEDVNMRDVSYIQSEKACAFFTKIDLYFLESSKIFS